MCCGDTNRILSGSQLQRSGLADLRCGCALHAKETSRNPAGFSLVWEFHHKLSHQRSKRHDTQTHEDDQAVTALEDESMERSKRKGKTVVKTIRIRRELLERLPVEPAHYAGVKGAGVAGFLTAVLEEALQERYGLAADETAQAT